RLTFEPSALAFAPECVDAGGERVEEVVDRHYPFIGRTTSEGRHQFGDLRFDAFQEPLRLATDRLQSALGPGLLDLLPLLGPDGALGDAAGVEDDLNAHVAGRGVRFKVNVRYLERLARGRPVGRPRRDSERRGNPAHEQSETG